MALVRSSRNVASPFKVSAPVVRVPIDEAVPLPAALADTVPSRVTLPPTVPAPPSVAPLCTVKAEAAAVEPFTSSVSDWTVVVPV